jgi:quercetin dioxygenase-like cupin family protein
MGLKALALAGMCLVLPAQAQSDKHSSAPGFALKQLSADFPKAEQLEARVRPVTIAPGEIGQWHTHASPPIVYVIEGTLSVEVKGQVPVETNAGEATMEPINTVIRAINKGQTPVKVVIFQVSPPEVPLSTPAPEQ